METAWIQTENPPYGGRGAFRKLTITLTPETYEGLINESTRRKIAGESNRQITCLVREALVRYLRRSDEENRCNHPAVQAG